MAINKNKVQLQETVLDSNGHPLSSTDVNPLTSSDCVIMENGMTLENVMGNDTVIDTPTIMNEDTSFKVGIGDSETKVIDSDVAKMVIEGKTYQNILPKPTTLIMNTDEKEFKINDKIDSSIVLDDNVAEIATIKGQTYVNVVQEESASEYVAIDEDLSGQSITTTGKPEGYVKNATLEGLTLVNTIQEPSGADATVLDLDADINAQSATIDNTVQGGIHGAILKGQTLVNVLSRTELSDGTVNIPTIPIDKTGGYTLIAYGDLTQDLEFNFMGYNSNGEHILNCPVHVSELATPKYFANFGDSSSDKVSEIRYRDRASETGTPIKYVLLAGDYTNIDIPYFEGMQSVEVPSVKTTGKNLFTYEMMETAGTNYSVGVSWEDMRWENPRRLRSIDTFNINPSKGATFKVPDGYACAIIGFKNNLSVSDTGWQNPAIIQPGDYDSIGFSIRYGETNISVDSIKELAIQLEEGTVATEYEPYQSSTVTTEKNLFDGILLGDYLKDETGQPNGITTTTHFYTPSYMPIQANEKFRLQVSSDTKIGDGRVYFYDKDYNYLNLYKTGYSTEESNSTSGDTIVTVPNNSNIAYMRVRFYDGIGVQADSVQINKVIVLRKVGDVQDELDLTTGKLTQRIGEIVLDGSEDWRISESTRPNHLRLYLDTRFKQYQNVINDKFADNGDIKGRDIEGIYMSNTIDIQVEHLRLSEVSVDGFKEWLSNNNIKVQVMLSKESIKTVDLTIQDQDNNSLKSIQTHPTVTHISTSSQGLIPNITIPSQLKYPTIIKPSTTYTVQLKQTTTNSEFPLTINLGGTVMAVPSTKFTITTPETLTSQDVIFTGKNNVIGEVVITEGDTTGIEYPYFEGMSDVKSPKLLATGKNLCYLELGYINSDYGTDSESPGSIRTNYVQIDPTKRYVITGLNKEASSFVAFYDTNKNFISRLPGTKREYIVLSKSSFTPSETRYVRVTNYGTDVSLDTPILFEKIDEGNTSYEPYKGVTIEQSIDSIPLTSDMFEQGGYDGSSTSIIKGMSVQQFPTSSRTDRIKSKTLIKVKPNTTYNINDLRFSAITFDKNGGYNNIIDFCTSFTTDANTYYLGVNLSKTGNSDITPSDLDSLNLTLQEVADEIVLRSIGDVKDTLNLTTGEYVQRIGEVVLDGSTIWIYGNSESGWNQNGTATAFYSQSSTTKLFANKKLKGNSVCDRMTTMQGSTIVVDEINIDCFGLSHAEYVVIRKNGVNEPSELRTWLAQNPITVQYELATPIIHKVNLTNTTKLPSYASTTHYDTIVPSNSLVPNIKISSTIDYNVAIKPSTQYTIRANTTSAMSVNLGGSTGTLANGKVTLTTPSALAHNSLKLGNGKAKEVMVIEGSEIKDNVPFFNGMKNVQMGGIKLVNIARGAACSGPVTTNTNKTQFTYTNSSSIDTGTIAFTKELVKPNTLYTIYCKIPTNTINREIKIQIGDGETEYLDIPTNYTGVYKTLLTSPQEIKHVVAIYFRSSSTLGQVVIQNPMIIEGDWTHLDEIPFIESEMIIEQPIIRSQGKNLFDIKETSVSWYGAIVTSNADNTITYTPNSDNSAALTTKFYFKQPIKVKTGIKYTYAMKRISGGNSDFSGTINNQILVRKKDGTIDNRLGMSDFNTNTFNQTLTATYIFDDTVESIIGISPIMYGITNLTSPIVMQFQIEEGSTATPYEPFKQHTLSSNRVIGYEENCYHDYRDGVKTAVTKNYNSVLADVEGLSIAYVTNGSSNFSFWDKDMVFISGKAFLDTSLSADNKNGFIAVPSNAKYMRFASGNKIDSATDYTKATVTGELPLRSLPNGVCDSLNLVTGEYVQRIKEVTFDGTETWGLSGGNYGNCLGFIIRYTDIVNAGSGNVNFNVLNGLTGTNMTHMEVYHYDRTAIRVLIGKEYLKTQDVDGLKQYLSQNPITVQYELETPIVRKIGLTAKGNYKESLAVNNLSAMVMGSYGDKTYRMQGTFQSDCYDDSPIFTDGYHVRHYPTDSHGEYEYIALIGNFIYINILKDGAYNDTIGRQWLSQHPIKVGYISTAQSATSYSNISKPIFFKNVKVQFMNDNVDIQPTLTLQARSTNSYVLDNIKPSTQYTSKFWHGSYTTIRVKIDNNYFNISNNTTFNSPSTLTNKLLVVAEGVQEFMIIEGDLTGKTIPYYKGIRSSFDNTDKVEAFVRNKNLVKELYPMLNNNTCVIENGVITIKGDGDGSGESNYVFNPSIYLEKDKTYTFSFSSDAQFGKTSGTDTVEAFLLKDGGTGYYIETYGFTKVFTCGATGYYNIRLDINKNNTTHKFYNIQIEESPTATPYQPHKENSTIINMPTKLETVKVVKVDMLKDMEIGAINHNTGANKDSSTSLRTKNYIPVQPSMHITYCNNGVERATHFVYYDINKNFIGARVYVSGVANKGTITTPDNCYFIRLYHGVTNADNLTITKQQYKPIALNELPNGVKDELIINRATSSAKLIRRVGKVVLDGSESWSFREKKSWGEYQGTLCYTTDTYKDMKQYGSNNIVGIISDRFRPTFMYPFTIFTGYYGQKNIALCMPPLSMAETGESIKQYLKQNPLTVYYELAEPVITEIRLKGYPFVYEDGSITLNTDIAPVTRTSYNVNQHQLINSQNETIIRHDKQISDLYDYIEIYLDEIYRMELFKMQLELSL